MPNTVDSTGGKLLLATHNRGKVQEYRCLLHGLPFQLTPLTEQGITTVVEEIGESLEENARLKAEAIARESRLLTMADDSGLEVDALGGEPGRLSARYVGEDASDEDRLRYLLSRMEDVRWEQRTARFRCVIALATPLGPIELCSGACEGMITFEPRGNQGFGYDPIFCLPERRKTMAELSLKTKNELSHRGKAARKAYELLSKPPFSTYYRST